MKPAEQLLNDGLSKSNFLPIYLFSLRIVSRKNFLALDAMKRFLSSNAFLTSNRSEG
jgi:hypothetical protein